MTTSRTCPRCGAAFEASASPLGLCPRCALAQGIASDPALEVVQTRSRAPHPPPPPPAELAGHFPGLAIESLLAVGGMGAVYRARQKSLEREVALKILHADIATESGFAERFAREAQTLAALAHANIVSIHDHGRAGPWFYFVMEFVDGASLRQMLSAQRIAPREALAIVAQLCDALQYAHDHGVVHRDIKPENVLLDRQGRVKILDFGLARLVGRAGERERLTHTHQVMGTPHYMAPEQWERPLEVDHRADIYSLGVVFYELLTGELPIGRFAPPSQRVAVDVRLDEVVLRTLEKQPELRYQKASEVKTDVDRIRTQPASAAPEKPAESAPLSPASEREPARPPARRATQGLPRFVWVLCALYVLVGMLVFLFIVLQLQPVLDS